MRSPGGPCTTSVDDAAAAGAATCTRSQRDAVLRSPTQRAPVSGRRRRERSIPIVAQGIPRRARALDEEAPCARRPAMRYPRPSRRSQPPRQRGSMRPSSRSLSCPPTVLSKVGCPHRISQLGATPRTESTGKYGIFPIPPGRLLRQTGTGGH